MRDLILKRIIELKEKENGFLKTTMRWRYAEYNNKHFSVLKFEELNDENLIDVFERVLLRYYKSMG